MKTFSTLLVSAALLASIGCAMCDSPHICKYGSYGGVIERLDPVNGRLGSILDPAESINHSVATPEASVVISDGEPSPAIESPSDETQAPELNGDAYDDATDDLDVEDSTADSVNDLDLQPEDLDSNELPEIEEMDDIPSADELFGPGDEA